ncbi:DUF4419 domain-containing protein [Taibaiella lutea]|uniref:DUF4419 domain-containing protein n=1 Tax=Taibaiella lutea TaxID=2608001 RepID=A0A5M6CP94_9BACT|nr:DUF4419 domain-containing protein [Taibaiella lutea]
MDELDPILDEFINASNGKFDKAFWRNMFKYHTEKEYGAPKIIDGWAIKFYPYDKTGKRNDFKMLYSSESLPDERAVVDFKRIDLYPDGHSKTFPMQFVAGFFGLKQNHKTQALEPQIGWLVMPKDTSDKYASQIAHDQEYNSEIRIRVSEIPGEILKLPRINSLSVEFIDSIKIPAELSLIDISYLSLEGDISEKELNKIDSLFPYTIVSTSNHLIHSEFGNKTDYGFYTIDKISQEHWKYVDLYISGKEVVIPESFANKIIDRINIDCRDLTPENKQKIIDKFPNSYLTINDVRIENQQYHSSAKKRKERYEHWKLNNPD